MSPIASASCCPATVYLLDDDVDLKSNDDNNESPHACHKPTLVRPKITGINQFHNHITGSANNKLMKSANTKNPKNKVRPAIICAPIMFLQIYIEGLLYQMRNTLYIYRFCEFTISSSL